jgi:hypothetical protein
LPGPKGQLLDATARYQEPLTEARLCGWQQALLPESRDQQGLGVGALREGWVGVLSGTIGRETVHFEGVPAHAVVRAGIAHLWLVTIHPFDDGNGRVSRADSRPGNTRVSIPTATRRLAELVALGCLLQRGGGRSSAYDLPWEQPLRASRL